MPHRGIGGLSALDLLLLLAIAILLFSGKNLLEVWTNLCNALSNFRGGGPGSPSHPIPSNDSAILNRRRKRRAANE